MRLNHELSLDTALSKVPALTLVFWIIKILATTLGETAGDALSMSMNLGYLLSTLIFAGLFLAAVIAQIKASKFLRHEQPIHLRRFVDSRRFLCHILFYLAQRTYMVQTHWLKCRKSLHCLNSPRLVW